MTKSISEMLSGLGTVNVLRKKIVVYLFRMSFNGVPPLPSP